MLDHFCYECFNCCIIVDENIFLLCPENKQIGCLTKHSLISNLRPTRDVSLMPTNHIYEDKECCAEMDCSWLQAHRLNVINVSRLTIHFCDTSSCMYLCMFM